MSVQTIAKRVALVASYAPSLIRFRGDLIREIAARGHHVLCLAPDLDDDIRAQLAGHGADASAYPLERTGLNPADDRKSLKALGALFRDWRPDVVMGYTPKPAIYASMAAREAGVARIVPMLTGLGYAFLPGGGLKRRVVREASKRLYRNALKGCHGVIFHNSDDYDVLRKAGCVPSDLPVTIVDGSGVDLRTFAALPLPSAGGGLTFLMISRLLRNKGVIEYCAAAGELTERAPTARWLLVGPEESGPAGLAADQLAASGGAVTYVGAVDDVRPYLAQCHVYVLPSYGEGMPRTVLEALATGRPVITTDARGCRETVADGVNGLLVPVGDAAGLANAMETFLKRPDLIPAMAKESRRLAEDRFDVRKVNAAMLTALGLD